MAIEGGLGIDTGTGVSNPPNVASGAFSFGRTSAVCLGRDDWGYVTFGRQYTPLWSISAGGMNDPFGGNFFGGINPIYSDTIRASNAVVYSYGYTWETMLNPSPAKGLGVALMYSAGEATAPSPERSGSQWGASVSYGGQEGWWIGYGIHEVTGSNSTMSATAPVASSPLLRQQTLGASYDFGMVRVYAGVNLGSNGSDNGKTGGIDSQGWDFGAKLQLTPLQRIRFLYGQKWDQTTNKANLQTAQLSYEYSLRPCSTNTNRISRSMLPAA